MRKNVLMLYEEPTDDELQFLMKEVAIEAREKIGKINQSLNKRIKNELDILIQKFKSVNE